MAKGEVKVAVEEAAKEADLRLVREGARREEGVDPLSSPNSA